MKNKIFTSQGGYTLLEIFISVSLLSVILAVAFPNLAEFVERRRVIANAQEISDLLSAARQQAVSTNENIQVCWNLNDEGTDNETTVGVIELGHGDFAMNNFDVAGAEQDLLDRTNFSGSRSVLRSANAAGSCLQFGVDGRANAPSTFFVCRSDGEDDGAAQVVIDNAGRAQIVRGVTGGSC